jgi:NADPH-dependent F420 reductase
MHLSYYHMPARHVTRKSVSRIGLIGGTGSEGHGLALRFALAGEDVIIGSRSRSRAEHAAAVVRAQLGGRHQQVFAGTNIQAGAESDVACVCLPLSGVEATLGDLRAVLRGKTVIEVVNPVRRTQEGFESITLPAPSAAEWLAALLPDSAIVSTFKTLSAKHMCAIDRKLHGDAFVCGDDGGAKGSVLDLVRRIAALRPVDCGPLRNARYVEAATVLLLELNRQHRIIASLRVLGLDSDSRD